MPLVEPASGQKLREKILLLGGAGSGKTTAYLSIAWWAFHSGDTRKFVVMDTDDEAVLQVMSEPKYAGMLAEDGGNVHVTTVVDWEDYQAFSEKAVADTKFGDWICLDFVTAMWTAAQEGFLQEAHNKSRGEALYEAGVRGLTGWEQFSAEINWNSVNGSYHDAMKRILLKSRAHVFMVAEEEVLDENRVKGDAKEHVAQFSKYKAKGQKSLPYQCRSYLRIQRLSRGRVLFTNGKDRARQEFNGETISPDFMSFYLKGAAGWTITDPA